MCGMWNVFHIYELKNFLNGLIGLLIIILFCIYSVKLVIYFWDPINATLTGKEPWMLGTSFHKRYIIDNTKL